MTVSRVPLWHWQTIRGWADAYGRLPAKPAGPAVSPAEVKRVQTAIREECERIADSFGEDLGEPLGRPRVVATLATTVGTNGRLYARRGKATETGAEWDWWAALSVAERRRLARDFTTPTGLAPDQLADMVLADRFGMRGADVDSIMSEWVARTRIVGVARSLAKGYVPSPAGYGDLTASDILPELAAEYGDLARIFGTGAGAYLAERAAEQVADVLPLTARLGPSPLDMDYEDWCAEVAELEERTADIQLVDGWASAEDEAALDRLRELVPASLGELVDAGASIEDLYVAAIGAYLAAAV